ncbi:hypothetical protein GGR57DRAFT_469628 [Xylariaceae sp. FL1272]|nr:hypothetical protein GGR57DRAFT_469628 [Xylariaceae sp. FL1272]
MALGGACTTSLRALLLVLFIHAHHAFSISLSWGSQARLVSESPVGHRYHTASPSLASQLIKPEARLSSSYDVALNELRELESEPLCHRTAARLLVNNCQLLEGKDEATILTDSGRQIRDFVDAYAASLAICDLERGRFAIPAQCAKFQESILSRLPIHDTAFIHVTSAEIDACLSGLGTSNSAWNTWVSYRHKALRFCEAARADNQKDQNILLFQRLTKIMSSLTDNVDEMLERRTRDFEASALATEDRIHSLSPQLHKLQQGLANVDMMISHQLGQALQRSQGIAESNLESAASLGRMLQMILKGVLDGHAESSAIHEQSLQLMRREAAAEVEIMMNTMAAAVTVTSALQEQLENSHTRAAEMQSKQTSLEEGMERLVHISSHLASDYNVHTGLLHSAQNMTEEILYVLGDTAASAASVGDLLGHRSSLSWWPYIWCPAATLVMGSYGLPPSFLRNLALFAMGEIGGFMVSSIRPLSFDHLRWETPNLSNILVSSLKVATGNKDYPNATAQFEPV